MRPQDLFIAAPPCKTMLTLETIGPSGQVVNFASQVLMHTPLAGFIEFNA